MLAATLSLAIVLSLTGMLGQIWRGGLREQDASVRCRVCVLGWLRTNTDGGATEHASKGRSQGEGLGGILHERHLSLVEPRVTIRRTLMDRLEGVQVHPRSAIALQTGNPGLVVSSR